MDGLDLYWNIRKLCPQHSSLLCPQAIQPTQKSRRSRKVGLAGLTEVQAGEIIFNLAMKHSFI